MSSWNTHRDFLASLHQLPDSRTHVYHISLSHSQHTAAFRTVQTCFSTKAIKTFHSNHFNSDQFKVFIPVLKLGQQIWSTFTGCETTSVGLHHNREERWLNTVVDLRVSQTTDLLGHDRESVSHTAICFPAPSWISATKQQTRRKTWVSPVPASCTW